MLPPLSFTGRIGRVIFATFIILLLNNSAKAQTTLVKGDISFTGYFGNGTAAVGGVQLNDKFSFVLLTNISAGTTINFTDNGWLRTSSTSGSFRTGEGTVTYTSNAAYTAGTEILITVTGTSTATATLVSGASAGTATGATMPSLSANGDQVIAYQGTAILPVFISAIHMNVYAVATGIPGVPGGDPVTTTTTDWDGSYDGSNASGLPALTGTNFLTNGTNALWIPGTLSAEKDNARFNCTGSGPLNTAAQVRAAVNNVANWTTSDEDPAASSMVLPTGCSYIVVLPAPTINSSPANSSICEGNNATFTFSASNATTYQWQVNTGSGFVDITNNTVYSGATTTTLTITGALSSMSGYLYRGVASNGSGSANSNAATLTVTPLPLNPTLLSKTPASLTVADGTPVKATFSAGSGGTTCTDDYRYTTDGGATYLPYTPNTNISTTGLAAGTGFIFIEGRRAACASMCQNSYVVLASWAVTPLPAAATTLNAGDIAFTGYIGGNNTASDEFSFVLLKNIGPNTVINFTTTGWLSTGSFGAAEETVTWTSPSGLPAGTEIQIAGLTATKSGGGAAGTVTGTGGGLQMSVNGDQILAYRGSAASPTFISAIHMNVFTTASGDPVNTTAAAWDGTASGINASALPTGLTTGTNAIWIGTQGDITSEYDNAKFGNCSISAVQGSIIALRAALNNQSNWIRSNGGDPASITLPTGCNYLTRQCAAITVTNPGVTTATNGTAFSQTFTQSGGSSPVTFSTASTLPNGLTLSSAGVLSGTPAAPSATYSIVVVATDVNGCTGTASTYNLVLSGPITYYPKATSTDLSLTTDWTTDVNGGAGTSPSNFTSANQAFNVNRAGTVLNNLTISGGSNLSVTTASGLVFGPLARFTVGAGSAANFGGNSVTFRSTSAGTASLGVIAGNLTNATNVTVERYIPARRAWRLMTAPLSNTNTIYQAWQNGGVNAAGTGTFVTGLGGTNGLDNGNTYSLKTFDIASQLLLPVTNTNVSLSAAAGSADNKGYFMFVRGDRNAANLTPPNTNITTLSSKGNLQTGTQSFTASGTAGTFTLVGNPYVSPVDFSLLTRTNILKRFYAWDPALNTVGGYVTVDDQDGDGTYSIIPASTQTSILQSSQAFFVQTNTTAAASIAFTESSKSSVTTGAGFRTGNGSSEVLRTSLYLKNTDTSILADGVLAEYNNNYSKDVTIEDAPKFGNINENLAIQRAGYSLAIERRPLVDVNDTLFLNLTNTTSRNYSFTFEPSNISSVVSAWLEDSYLKTSTPLSLTAPATVDFGVDANTASADANRFIIVFKTNGALPISAINVKAYQQNAGIQVDWNVATESYMSRYEVEKSADGQTFAKVGTAAATGNSNAAASYNWFDATPFTGSNFYRIKAMGKSGEVSYSQVVNVKVGNGRSDIVVYPNPVHDKTITLQFSNEPTGTYTVQLFNGLGQQVLTKTIEHLGGSATQTIQLGSLVSKGVYQLHVSSGNNKVNQQIIVQ